ncbi:MAG: hypothetical protein RBR78_08570 [Flavobacteriaceae bacterium]|jgi:hypothetical protein|nr:hypothetical protein [Flavobacteriaceae bacterium]
MKNTTLHLFTFLFFLMTSLSFAQQSKVDSLWIEFRKSKTDTIKINILEKIAIDLYYEPEFDY